jgi:hypothetical protein
VTKKRRLPGQVFLAGGLFSASLRKGLTFFADCASER